MVVLSQPAKAKFVRKSGCSHFLRPQRPVVSPHPHERRNLNSHRSSPCAVPTRSDSATRLASFPRPDGTRRTSHAFRWPGRTENPPSRTRLIARSNCSLKSQNSDQALFETDAGGHSLLAGWVRHQRCRRQARALQPGWGHLLGFPPWQRQSWPHGALARAQQVCVKDSWESCHVDRSCWSLTLRYEYEAILQRDSPHCIRACRARNLATSNHDECAAGAHWERAHLNTRGDEATTGTLWHGSRIGLVRWGATPLLF